VYLANNDPRVGGASHYGQHLQRAVNLQYSCVVAVTVYVLLLVLVLCDLCVTAMDQ